jgi:hypothetical protein
MEVSQLLLNLENIDFIWKTKYLLKPACEYDNFHLVDIFGNNKQEVL